MTLPALIDFWFLRAAHIFNWYDILEITCISTLFYYVSAWLAHDKRNNLVLYFYSYCFALLGSYYAQLSTLFIILCAATPFIGVIFIMLHQKTLQKNFVALKKNSLQENTQVIDWPSVLMRSSLIALNNNTQITCLIERHDALATFVSSALPINAPIHQGLLDCIIASPSFDPHAMTWISAQGNLIGVNAHWLFNYDASWSTDEVKELESHKQDALFITAKTDAIMFMLCPTSRLATIIANGKALEKLTCQQAATMLHNLMYGSSVEQKKGEYSYEKNTRQNTYQQRNS